ncbi:MAG: hypothetical protein FWG50_01095 [Kiritimatiellaeota bacterium]|nr:hypothetical protein [Kiritimatiellota bacterium]
MHRTIIRIAVVGLGLAACAVAGAPSAVDATSLKGKWMCGYQGWFRTPGDGAGMGWDHYSRLANEIRPDTLVVDMWPDTADFADATAIFKVSPVSPVTAHFVDTEGMPADWHLRLIKEARRILRDGEPFPEKIPLAAH